MPSNEVNSICLPLTPGVQALLEDIEKQLAHALDILDHPPNRCGSTTDYYVSALRAGRSLVSDLQARLRRVLDAADAALPYDIGL